MATYAFRLATQQHLQKHLGLTDNECRMMLGPEPTGVGGRVFIAIHELKWTNTAKDLDHVIENYEIGITVSIRAGSITLQRFGQLVQVDEKGGLDFYVRKCMGLITGNYAVASAADLILIGNPNLDITPAPFFMPLEWQYGGIPQARNSSWWGGEGGGLPVGISQTLVFEGGSRIMKTTELPI